MSLAMDFKGKRILLTGATGGIGRHIATKLASQGAQLMLLGSNQSRLDSLVNEIKQDFGIAIGVVADLSEPSTSKPSGSQQGTLNTVVEAVKRHFGSIDILINNAALIDFTVFEQQSADRIAEVMQVNVITPMQLVRSFLPDFIAADAGHIVNIGSAFGSIAFPHYVTYSASKYAMRGFSQALRRELIDTNIAVTYIAPRAVKTALNDEYSVKMMAAANIQLDDPDIVADLIIASIKSKRQELYIGQPETFFAWINGILPRIVNIGLRQKTRIARLHALRHFKGETS